MRATQDGWVMVESSDNCGPLKKGSPVDTAEFSKFAGILSAALSQHQLLGSE